MFSQSKSPKSLREVVLLGLVIFLFSIVFIPITAEAAFPSDWTRKAPIVIDHTKVSGDLENFPLLLTEDTLPTEMFDADGDYPALSNGADIRFTADLAGDTKLAAEIVSFVTDNDPSNGTAQIWLKVPSVSSTADTTIYVWYNALGKSQPSRSSTADVDGFPGSDNVWSAYHGVAHLEGTTDSKSSNRTLLNTGGPTLGIEKIANGYSYNGSSQYTDMDNYSWEVPAYNDATWANTGLAYDDDDNALWIGDWENNRLVKTSLSGTFLTSINISAAPQGLAYDGSDSTIWWADFNNTTVRHIDKSGVDQGDSISLGFAPNGLSYEAATDSIWIAQDGTNTVHRYSASTGTFQETLTIVGAGNIDGVAYDPREDVLYLNVDTGQLLFKVSAGDGAVEWSTDSVGAPEDIALVGDVLYMSSDTEFHAAIPDGNRVYKWDVSRFADNFSVALWFDLDVNSTTDFLFGQGAPLTIGSGGWGFYITSATGLRLFITDANAQIQADRTLGAGFRRIWMTVDRTNGLARLYDNGSLLGDPIDISTIAGVVEDGRPPRIGASFTPDRHIDAHIDEVVFYSGIVSPEFISTEFQNQNSPSTFVTVGTVSSADPIPPVPSTITFSNITTTSITATTTATDDVALAALPFVYHATSTGYDVYSGATSSTWILTDLTPNTAYSFEVGVQDLAGNWATSTIYSTTTLALPVESSPTVTASIRTTSGSRPAANQSKQSNTALIANLEAQITALKLQLNALLPSKSISNTITFVVPTRFDRDLKLGSTGPDVKALQQFLNTHGFILVASGPGSPGKETEVFGYATEYQLKRFQEANQIFPAVGYFGPKTRTFITNY